MLQMRRHRRQPRMRRLTRCASSTSSASQIVPFLQRCYAPPATRAARGRGSHGEGERWRRRDAGLRWRVRVRWFSARLGSPPPLVRLISGGSPTPACGGSPLTGPTSPSTHMTASPWTGLNAPNGTASLQEDVGGLGDLKLLLRHPTTMGAPRPSPPE